MSRSHSSNPSERPEPLAEPVGAPAGQAEDGGALAEALDPASRSLNESLRISFGVLKVVMVVLVVWFLFSGVRQVPEGAVAIRLHFGRVVGRPGEQVLPPGWHFAWPEPIDRVVIVPTGNQTVELDKAFWLNVEAEDRHKSIEELAATGKYSGAVTPGKVGSMVTGDWNLVHGQWQINWRVRPEDVVRFVRTVSDDTRPVRISESQSIPRMMLLANDFLKPIGQRVVMQLVAQTPVDAFLRGHIDRDRARRLMQRTLDALGAGITVEGVLLQKFTPPLSVREAFQDLSKAESAKAEAVEKARQEYQRIVNEVAGPAYQELVQAIEHYEQVRRPLDEARRQAAAARQAYQAQPTEEHRAQYQRWQQEVARRRADLEQQIRQADRRIARLMESEQVSGQVSRIIKEALAYKRTLSERILAEASLFDSYYQVFKQNPALRQITVQRLWEDARQEIFRGDVETFYLPGDVSELWLDVSRDPRVLNKRTEQQVRRKIQEEGRRASEPSSEQ